MIDLERLEAELATDLRLALRSYAAEADVTVDAAETARTIARWHPRRSWLGSVAGALPVSARTAARAILVAAALLLLLMTVVVVGQSLFRSSVSESPVRGHAECVQTSEGTRTADGATVVVTGVVFECQMTSNDSRTNGALSLVITRSLVDGHNGTQLGTAEIRATEDTWSGTASGLFVEDGLQTLHVTLGGEGPFRNQHLGLALVSSDGLHWAIRGTTGPRP